MDKKIKQLTPGTIVGYWDGEPITITSDNGKIAHFSTPSKGSGHFYRFGTKPDPERYRARAGYWTLERCIESAKKFQTRIEWRKNANAAIQAAFRNKWLKQCCEHMGEPLKRPQYTKEEVIAIARRYESRGHFKSANGGAYMHAFRNEYLDEACAHMRRKPVKPK